MTLAVLPGQSRVEMRLARHYLNKLRTASLSVQHGQSSFRLKWLIDGRNHLAVVVRR